LSEIEQAPQDLQPQYNQSELLLHGKCKKRRFYRHNHRILSKTTKATNTSDTTAGALPEKKCNCRKANECPLGKHCLKNSLVYQAEVTTRDNGEIKHYVGMTANSFKERYRNHQKSFTNATYKNETELSKYIWKLKQTTFHFNLVNFKTCRAVFKQWKAV
jgi:hypothetical protein